MTTITQRRDGRRNDETREIHISFDGLARVDGSARFSFGPVGPSALSSISGPIEVRLNAENASQATFEVLVRPLSNVPATEAKALAATLRSLLSPSLILSHNPRTLVQLVAQALVPSSSDALVAALINSSALALLNAGSIPMQGVVCAVAVGRRRSDAALIADPDEQYEAAASLDAHGCFAFMFSGERGGVARCVWTNWRSAPGTVLDEKAVAAARELAARAAGSVYEAVYESVVGMGKMDPVVATHTEAAQDKDDDEKMEI